MGAWVHGCMGAWVHGCMGAGSHGAGSTVTGCGVVGTQEGHVRRDRFARSREHWGHRLTCSGVTRGHQGSPEVTRGHQRSPLPRSDTLNQLRILLENRYSMVPRDLSLFIHAWG